MLLPVNDEPFAYISPSTFKMKEPKKLKSSYEDFVRYYDRFPTTTEYVVELEKINSFIRKSKIEQDQESFLEFAHAFAPHEDFYSSVLESLDIRYQQIMKFLKNKNSFYDLINVYIYWLEGNIPKTPTYVSPALVEKHLKDVLIRMNHSGFLTIDSQAFESSVNEDGTMTLQRPYVSGYLSPKLAIGLAEQLRDKYQIIVISGNDSVEFETQYPLTYDSVDNDYEPDDAFTGFREMDKYSIIDVDDLNKFLTSVSTIQITYPKFNEPNSDDMFDDIVNVLEQLSH